MPRRSRPLTIAPLIPLLAIIGFLGVNQLHSRFLTVFVIVWSLLFAALLIYVFTKMMEAKRARSGR
jgi:hypothetical protein